MSTHRLIRAFRLPVLSGLLMLAPVAYAQSASASSGSACSSGIHDLASFFQLAICIIDNFAVPLVFAIAFIVFLWGVYTYFIAGAANQEKRQEGQKLLLYGLIGFFVMFAVWGIVNLLLGTFQFSNPNRPCYPTFGGAAQSGCSGTSATTNTGDLNKPLGQ